MKFWIWVFSFVAWLALPITSAWSAADIVIKEGRIPVEIFTSGKKFLIETQHNGVPIRVFLPPEAFATGGSLSPGMVATVRDDVTTSISTKNFLYFYLNDEGTSPSWQYSGNTSLLLTFFDVVVQSTSLRANMEYKVWAPGSPGFPIARIEAYPEPHEVNTSLAPPAAAGGSGASPCPPPALAPGTTAVVPAASPGAVVLPPPVLGEETPAEISGERRVVAGEAGGEGRTLPPGNSGAGANGPISVGGGGGCQLGDGPAPGSWLFFTSTVLILAIPTALKSARS